MCWCTPEIRTPNCGKIGCHPPKPKIDWDKVWEEIWGAYDDGTPGESCRKLIQQLVEKQLAGEE